MNSKAPTPPPENGPSTVRPSAPPPRPPKHSERDKRYDLPDPAQHLRDAKPGTIYPIQAIRVVTSIQVFEDKYGAIHIQQQITDLVAGESKWEDVPVLQYQGEES